MSIAFAAIDPLAYEIQPGVTVGRQRIAAERGRRAMFRADGQPLKCKGNSEFVTELGAAGDCPARNRSEPAKGWCPAEHILLGSIVGLGIAVAWLWIVGRAAG